MYHLCLLEPALFRFLHDAPRSELLIDLPLNCFMTLRGHLALEDDYCSRTKQQGSGEGGGQNMPRLCGGIKDFDVLCSTSGNIITFKKILLHSVSYSNIMNVM